MHTHLKDDKFLNGKILHSFLQNIFEVDMGEFSQKGST